MSLVSDIFKESVQAIRDNVLIQRTSTQDKEFHFQNWFTDRLQVVSQRRGKHFDNPGRNSYPDFRVVEVHEGYEIKGLAYPGRDASFDSNSQVPTGFHNGRTIFYVFGRYPAEPDGDTYPVLDLLVCHGDFLNADHEYIHKNKHVKGFGSYGDIMIRDRKMYVIPTPFHLAEGIANHYTLILPSATSPGNDFVQVGDLVRREADRLVVLYSFDLRSNEIRTQTVENPNAGRQHSFRAWRISGADRTPVRMRRVTSIEEELESDDKE